MNQLTRRSAISAMLCSFALGGILDLHAGDWTAPVEVQHEFQPCISYQARLDGDQLVVRATIAPGWHTFSMDNKQRAAEKLAGKKSLGIDAPTEISASGLEITGPWFQSEPKDFSKPELRWYSWGFEQQAIFATKVKRTGSGPAELAIKGQACTETTCKNIEVAISVPASAAKSSQPPDLKSLIQVR